jgi:hypothetical protein
MGRKLAIHMKPHPSLPGGRSFGKMVRISFRNGRGNSFTRRHDGYYEHTSPQCKTERSLRFDGIGIWTVILSETEGNNSKFVILAPKSLKGWRKKYGEIEQIWPNNRPKLTAALR